MLCRHLEWESCKTRNDNSTRSQKLTANSNRREKVLESTVDLSANNMQSVANNHCDFEAFAIFFPSVKAKLLGEMAAWNLQTSHALTFPMTKFKDDMRMPRVQFSVPEDDNSKRLYGNYRVCTLEAAMMMDTNCQDIIMLIMRSLFLRFGGTRSRNRFSMVENILLHDV